VAGRWPTTARPYFLSLQPDVGANAPKAGRHPPVAALAVSDRIRPDADPPPGLASVVKGPPMRDMPVASSSQVTMFGSIDMTISFGFKFG
jgi:hypothetical protein